MTLIQHASSEQSAEALTARRYRGPAVAAGLAKEEWSLERLLQESACVAMAD